MPVAADLATLRAEITALREDFNQLTEVVTQQARIIRDFEDERQRRLGAQGAVRFIWAVITTGIAGVAYSLHDIVAYLWPPKGH